MTVLSSLLVLLLPSCQPMNPLEGGMVQRLLAQRKELVQPGLSYITGDPGLVTSLSLQTVLNISSSSQVRSGLIGVSSIILLQVGCVINIENWSKWLLSYPVYYFKHGTFHNSELIYTTL